MNQIIFFIGLAPVMCEGNCPSITSAFQFIFKLQKFFFLQIASRTKWFGQSISKTWFWF
jgi:hypothetical protein